MKCLTRKKNSPCDVCVSSFTKIEWKFSSLDLNQEQKHKSDFEMDASFLYVIVVVLSSGSSCGLCASSCASTHWLFYKNTRKNTFWWPHVLSWCQFYTWEAFLRSLAVKSSCIGYLNSIGSKTKQKQLQRSKAFLFLCCWVFEPFILL